MSKLGFSGAGKFAAISLAIAAAVAMPLSASARGWGGHGHHGGYHNSYHNSYRGNHGGYYGHRGHWSGGRWIAGAIVTGAVIGLVADALRPAPGYYDSPVVYGPPPPTVVYEYRQPVVTRRVVQTRTVVYEDPYQTRYIRDDGYDDDDGH